MRYDKELDMRYCAMNIESAVIDGGISGLTNEEIDQIARVAVEGSFAAKMIVVLEKQVEALNLQVEIYRELLDDL